MEACRDELTVSSSTLADSECWVAYSKQMLCGCGCLTVAGGLYDRTTRDGEISLFFVDPDCQHQGVGTQLWQTLLERARYHRLRQLTLDADPFAQGFYERLGCKVIGQSASGSIPGRLLPHMRLQEL